MKPSEIPIAELPKFFRQFSETHRFERVSVETIEPGGQTFCNARRLPLMGILVEPEPDGGAGVGVTVLAGTALDAQVAHTIHQPTRVCIVEWRDRLASALEIADAAGIVTVLRLEPVAQESIKAS